MGSYDGCYEPCGGYNTCSTGCDCNTCPTDYNPISVNNNNAPNVEGSTSQGGTGQGGAGGTGGYSSADNTMNLSISGVGNSICGFSDCANCCKEGLKTLFNFIYNISIDPSVTVRLYAYGNVTTSQENLFSENALNLLNLTDIEIQDSSICGDMISTNEGIVSLCSISIVVFDFSEVNQNLAIKSAFKNDCSCNCSCECGKSIAKALCINGLGGSYDVIIQDSIDIDTLTFTTLYDVYLVAVDCNIAIFADSQTQPIIYYAIPTCKIAKFKKQ